MMEAVNRATKIMTREVRELELLQSSTKGPYKFAKVTVDKIYRAISNYLLTAKPAEVIMAKEHESSGIKPQSNSIEHKIFDHKQNNTSSEHAKGLRWVINPISGFNNFARCQVNYAISIALQELDQKTGGYNSIAVLVDLPAVGETYWAEKNGGAWLEKYRDTAAGRNKLKTAHKASLNEIFVAVNNYEDLNYISENSNLLNTTKNIQIIESPELSVLHIAAGKCDVLFSPYDKHTIQTYMLLATEAGGKLNSINHDKGVVLTSAGLYDAIRQLIT